MNFGYTIYNGIESNEYLNELYENILYNHSISLFNLSSLSPKTINIEDALQFADILSKSVHLNPAVADSHKIWGQEIVALLNNLEPKNPIVKHYLGAILATTGNYRGMFIKAPEYKDSSILDRSYNEFSKDMLSVPSNPEKHFFHSQYQAYKRFDDPYFSFSGPTSMGKSFVMQSFIKEQVLKGRTANFAIIVPTKALINEVSGNIITDLKELLQDKNYRVVTSAGALALEQPHNFIFVLTPERLLYLLIRHKKIDIDYLFVDEAHKISAPRDSRSPFYYKGVDMLLDRKKKPHIIFASPNIPNPEVYLGLIPDAEKTDHQLSSAFSPVTQIKYLLDTIEDGIKVYNEHTQKFVPITPGCHDTLNETLRIFFDKKSSSIVYINSRDEAMRMAQDFAKSLPLMIDPETDLPDKELEALAKEIRTLVHKEYYLAEVVTKGVAYHVGYLPPAIRLRIEELYRAQKIRVMFCTSTLLEGVNLPADNLFITTYYKGQRHFTPVDFRNLVGRVGRIKYNLYGNVFLTRLKKTTRTEKFIDYLQKDVPEQKLSLVTELTKPHKELIIQCLSCGNIEIPKDGMRENEYPIVRKFALILLRDIMRDRNSVVFKAFAELLNAEIIAKIKAAFAKSENQPDDDINTSIDQTNSLVKAIEDGLEYPKIDDANGKADYKEVLAFLQKLHTMFKWGIYETKKDGIGHPNSLTWYATLLCQWVSGSGLNQIMNSAVKNAQDRQDTNNPKTVEINGKVYHYDDTVMHRNLVVGEALQAIESVILFSFSNYFIKFTECYKKKKGVNPPYDWYEFVEYGTSNPLSIMLQRNGFSREAALYIKENKGTYVTIENGVAKLKRTIVTECPKESVRAEVAEIIYNAPELFID